MKSERENEGNPWRRIVLAMRHQVGSPPPDMQDDGLNMVVAACGHCYDVRCSVYARDFRIDCGGEPSQDHLFAWMQLTARSLCPRCQDVLDAWLEKFAFDVEGQNESGAFIPWEDVWRSRHAKGDCVNMLAEEFRRVLGRPAATAGYLRGLREFAARLLGEYDRIGHSEK